MQGDATFDTYLFRGIAGTGHNSTLSTGDYWLPAEFRMNGFLTGRKESIAVDMHDGLWPGMQAEYGVAHGNTSLMKG